MAASLSLPVPPPGGAFEFNNSQTPIVRYLFASGKENRENRKANCNHHLRIVLEPVFR
jgi:hypothetical protein